MNIITKILNKFEQPYWKIVVSNKMRDIKKMVSKVGDIYYTREHQSTLLKIGAQLDAIHDEVLTLKN